MAFVRFNGMRRFIFYLGIMLAASVRGAEIRIDFNGSLAGAAPTNFHAALAGSGQPGTDAEKNAITDGNLFYNRSKGTVALTLPFRDRNGDVMAAVHIRLKSFIGETQNNAVTRATILVKKMQAEVASAEAWLQ